MKCGMDICRIRFGHLRMHLFIDLQVHLSVMMRILFLSSLKKILTERFVTPFASVLIKLLAWADPTVMGQVQQLRTMPEVTPKELNELKNVSKLDVRRSAEFSGGAIENAIQIAHTRLLDNLSQLDSSTKWVVNCLGGSRSAAACMALRRGRVRCYKSNWGI